MARQPQPIDSSTKETLQRLHADYKTATSSTDRHTTANDALAVLAPTTDPKPRSRG